MSGSVRLRAKRLNNHQLPPPRSKIPRLFTAAPPVHVVIPTITATVRPVLTTSTFGNGCPSNRQDPPETDRTTQELLSDILCHNETVVIFIMLPNYNNHWQEARNRNTNRQPNQYHVPYNGPVFHRPLPPTNRRPPTNPSSYIPPHRRPTYNTAYQSRGNHRPDQQQKRLPAHRRQPVPTHKEEEPFVKVFFQVLQCLHHLAILTLQQQGQPAFTFKRKVSELDSFIRPAMKTSAVDANIRSLNRTWLCKVTQVLIDHYQTTLQEKLTTIRTKSLSSPAVDRIVSHALSWARRSYGKRLTQAVISKFYQTINETKTRVTISLPTEMDTTPAPPRATTLPNQTPK
ncbi:hypothetical protein LOTGIDRAFT_155210 [Lottia gigantea]|uniref:Uncharacterized protein n=1 Tax=Lottia gigantea TaxID=225164 RepID=V3ZN19_LOTGI|nr:hypothetical protein LOTGIDRAFT_155210 [Lottia gigantea]ESO85717.1 hypothetical protein LOTGIDRAFT_155210 [Lottia gigantea]